MTPAAGLIDGSPTALDYLTGGQTGSTMRITVTVDGPSGQASSFIDVTQ